MKKFRLSKSGHLFQTIFLILCLLVLCLLAYMTFFMDRYVFREQVHELDRSNLQVLEQVSDTVDQTVEDLERQVQIFLADQTLMQYLLNPQTSGAEDSIQILKNMKNYVELSPSVTQLWLYAPLSNSVLSSDGYLTSRTGSPADLVLNRYEEQAVSRSAPDLCLSAVTVDGKLYVLVDFVPSQQIGCFIFQLDPTRFGTDLSDKQGTILTVDTEGALLMNRTRLAYGSEYFSLSNQKLFYSDPAAQRENQRYYRVINEKLGWHFLLEVQDSATLYNPATFLRMILPVLAAMLVLGAVCAFFISRAIYLPINRLLSQVMEQAKTTQTNESTIDYLESAYHQTLEDNQHLQTQFAQLGRGMRQYLFRQAIFGELSKTADDQTVLDAFPKGIYQIALIRLGESDMVLQTALKNNLHLESLKHLAAQAPACLCCIEQEKDTLVLLFHQPGSTGDPNALTGIFQQFAQQAAQQTQCQLILGVGSSCSELYQLQQSYEQALQDLQYNAYLADDPDPAVVCSLQSKALEERLSRAVEQVALFPDKLEEEAAALVQTAERGAEDAHACLQNYLRLQDLFLERLAFQEEVQPLPQLTNRTPQSTDREHCLLFCRRALELSRSLAGKKKYRYVEEGKKFIEQNYTNCSLGLTDISDHVGTSPSYFSSLFNELARESVTSYLNRIRVEHAQSLLTVTHIPVKEIGFRCGFNSANVFGRVFKKYTGQSPKQFRDAHAAVNQEVERT